MLAISVAPLTVFGNSFEGFGIGTFGTEEDQSIKPVLKFGASANFARSASLRSESKVNWFPWIANGEWLKSYLLRTLHLHEVRK